jgi:integrase
MKIHDVFTLFFRVVPSGKKVVYYYAWDETNRRIGPWSTGETSKTAARIKCMALFKQGTLIPSRIKPVTFGEFADRFWERDSEYIRNQESRGEITDAYLENCQKMVKNQILPFFGDTPLEKMNRRDINHWLLNFKKREQEKDGIITVKAYKNTYANTVFGTLYTMMEFAAKEGMIPANPCATVRKLKNDRKNIEIITKEELRRLFPKNAMQIWQGREIAYIANRLASLTGMRPGEVLALKGVYLYERYIYVCASFGEQGYGPTKTKETRYIPLIPEMMNLLRKLAIKNGQGYVFSTDGGATPVSRKYLYNSLRRALQNIGLSREEIARRGLCLHAWRHFVNTDLQLQGLTIPQVQAVTGHKSDRMTELYNHPDARQIADVMKAQDEIYGKGEEGEKKADRPKIIKIRERPAGRTAVAR